MALNREQLEEVRAALQKAVDALKTADAPSGIAAYIELALARLDSFLAMRDRWDNGDPDINHD